MKIERVSDTQLKLTLTKPIWQSGTSNWKISSAPAKNPAAVPWHHGTGYGRMWFHYRKHTFDGGSRTRWSGRHHDHRHKGRKQRQKQQSYGAVPSGKRLAPIQEKPLATEEAEAKEDDDLLVYSFSKLDDVIDLSIRLEPLFYGASSLYKTKADISWWCRAIHTPPRKPSTIWKLFWMNTDRNTFPHCFPSIIWQSMGNHHRRKSHQGVGAEFQESVKKSWHSYEMSAFYFTPPHESPEGNHT